MFHPRDGSGQSDVGAPPTPIWRPRLSHLSVAGWRGQRAQHITLRIDAIPEPGAASAKYASPHHQATCGHHQGWPARPVKPTEVSTSHRLRACNSHRDEIQPQRLSIRRQRTRDIFYNALDLMRCWLTNSRGGRKSSSGYFHQKVPWQDWNTRCPCR
jgi:hypothetical protein